ncbi:MAG: hypothetical protein GX857_13635 [Bacteroidales bacterium]|jgi:hypothetical protein|nr:hypothetical protein [Bacteroidales bacterium]
MKTKRKLQFAALLIIILSSSFACDNNDGYSLNDFRISIASVVPEAGQSYSLLLDNGKKLWPAASDINYRPSANQRVFVNYTILSDKIDGFDHYIKVNDIWNVLTKSVIELTEQNRDSIGNDPVKMNDIWIGDHYLNTGFSFNYNGMKPHAINLVQNKITIISEDEDVIELEFRHNSYKSTSNSLFNGFACFDLRPFQREDKNSILIKVLVKEWDGEKEYEVTYNYNELTKDKTEAVTPNITSNEYK